MCSNTEAAIAEIWRLLSSFICLCLLFSWKMLGIASSVLFNVNLGSLGLSLLVCFLIEINCVLHTEASNIGSSYYHNTVGFYVCECRNSKQSICRKWHLVSSCLSGHPSVSLSACITVTPTGWIFMKLHIWGFY